MSSKLLLKLNTILNQIEHAFPIIFGRKYPPPAQLACLINSDHGFNRIPSTITPSNKLPTFSIKDLIGDGFLWAVPRNRRTIEKRWKRKFGTPELSNKLLLPKTNLRVCNKCGHHHEIGILCANCYKQVRAETEQMQTEIQDSLGLKPVDKEVIVLYEGEYSEKSNEFWNGKRIIEMKKPRPIWFTKNLLQKSTEESTKASSTNGTAVKEVKPDELG